MASFTVSIVENTPVATLRRSIKVKTKLQKKKTPWKTAVSVIEKNLGLFFILLLLVRLVSKLGFNYGGVGFEVAEALSEVVDRKLESEFSELRSELGKRMDELDAKIGSLEGVFNGKEWLTREEFVEDFKGRKGGEMGLDEIRPFAKGVVEKEIGKLAADGLGRLDYFGRLEEALNGNGNESEEFHKIVDEIIKGGEMGLDEILAFLDALIEKQIWKLVGDGLGRVDYAVASGGSSVVKHSEVYVRSGVSRVTEWLKGGECEREFGENVAAEFWAAG